MAVVNLEWVGKLGAEGSAVVGEVLWDAAPGVHYKLEVTPDGQLRQFTAMACTGGTVTARGLRLAPIGEMQRAVRKRVQDLTSMAAKALIRSDDQDQETVDAADRLRKAADDFSDRPRPGSAGRGDHRYAAVAAVYVDLLDAGDPSPVVTMASVLHLSVKTVRNLLYKAREKGLLTSAGRGRAGGQLTDKAKEILDGQH